MITMCLSATLTDAEDDGEHAYRHPEPPRRESVPEATDLDQFTGQHHDQAASERLRRCSAANFGEDRRRNSAPNESS